MRDSLNKKYNKLASVLKSHKKTLVALSGGLDSSFFTLRFSQYNWR